jgi:hypothetical protein
MTGNEASSRENEKRLRAPSQGECSGEAEATRQEVGYGLRAVAAVDSSLQAFLLRFVQAGSDSLEQILREIVSCHRAGRTRCATLRITSFSCGS